MAKGFFWTKLKCKEIVLFKSTVVAGWKHACQPPLGPLPAPAPTRLRPRGRGSLPAQTSAASPARAAVGDTRAEGAGLSDRVHLPGHCRATPSAPGRLHPCSQLQGPRGPGGLPETWMGRCSLAPGADFHLLLRAFWSFGAGVRLSIRARIWSRHSLLTLLLTRGPPRHCLCEVTGATACVLRRFHSPGLVVFLPSLPQTREMGAQGPGVGPGLWGLNSGARTGRELGPRCLVLSAKAELPRARAPRWLLTGSARPAALQPFRVLSPSSRQESSWGSWRHGEGLPCWVGPGVHVGPAQAVASGSSLLRPGQGFWPPGLPPRGSLVPDSAPVVHLSSLSREGEFVFLFSGQLSPWQGEAAGQWRCDLGLPVQEY